MKLQAGADGRAWKFCPNAVKVHGNADRQMADVITDACPSARHQR
jgi:hypothetical protein